MKPRFSPQMALLVALVVLMFLSLGAVRLAQAASNPQTAQGLSTSEQVPSWKIPPGTFGPRPSFTPWPAPTPETCLSPVDPLPPAGITNPDRQGGPNPSIRYPVNDSWAGQIGPDYLQVYGGGISANADSTPDTAAVWVYSYTESSNHCGWNTNLLGEFVLNGYKSLTITAVNGTIMTLTTETGHQVGFDLGVRHFL